jgi:hypothetical protein
VGGGMRDGAAARRRLRPRPPRRFHRTRPAARLAP